MQETASPASSVMRENQKDQTKRKQPETFTNPPKFPSKLDIIRSGSVLFPFYSISFLQSDRFPASPEHTHFLLPLLSFPFPAALIACMASEEAHLEAIYFTDWPRIEAFLAAYPQSLNRVYLVRFPSPPRFGRRRGEREELTFMGMLLDCK